MIELSYRYQILDYYSCNSYVQFRRRSNSRINNRKSVKIINFKKNIFHILLIFKILSPSLIRHKVKAKEDKDYFLVKAKHFYYQVLEVKYVPKLSILIF